MADWFVGRQKPLEVFDASLEKARSRNLTVVSVVASAGLGKSALLAICCEQALAAGAVVCRARAYEGADVPPLGVQAEWIRDLLAHLRQADPERTRRVEEQESVGLALVAPQYATRESVDRALDLAHYDQDVSISSLLGQLLALTDAPVVVAIDDLHRADDESVGSLLRLIDRHQASRLLLLAALRPTDLGQFPALDNFLETAERSHVGQIIRLPPLSVDEIGEYLERAGASEWSSSELAEASGGHPLVLRWLVEERTGSVALFVRSRMAGLDEEDRRLARELALYGLEFGAGFAAALSGIDFESARRAVKRLEGAMLVTDLGRERYVVFHDLVREQIVATMNDRARSAAHSRIGHALCDGDFLDPERRELTIGAHLMKSRSEVDVRAGVNYTMSAARSAERRGAWTDANAIWQRAAAVSESFTDEITRADIRFGLAKSLVFKPPQYPERYDAIPNLLGALQTYLDLQATDRIVQVSRIRWALAVFSYLDLFEQALGIVPEQHPDRALIEYRVGQLKTSLFQVVEGSVILRTARERAIATGHEWLVPYVDLHLALAALTDGDPEGAAEICESVRKSTRDPEPVLAILTAYELSAIYGWLGERERAQVEAEQALEEFRRARGVDFNLGTQIHSQLARFALTRGDWEKCVEYGKHETIFTRRPAITALYVSGQFDRGDELLESLMRGVRNDSEGWAPIAVMCLNCVAVRCRVTGERKYAQEARKWTRTLSRTIVRDLPFFEARRWIGQARLGYHLMDRELMGEAVRALEGIQRDQHWAYRTETKEHKLLSAYGVALWGTGRIRKALSVIERSAHIAESNQDRPGLAWIGLDLSRLYAELDLLMKAEETAQRALDLARSLDMPPLKARILEGSTPVDRVKRLTPRERAVLELVGRGLANKEISAQLDISIHTAGNHIRHILEKLGCANRAEAAVLVRGIE